MIFISLTPFVPKRLFLFFAAATCLSCVSCFAQPVFFAVNSTPYDNQMIRVRAVLQRAKTAQEFRDFFAIGKSLDRKSTRYSLRIFDTVEDTSRGRIWSHR